MSRRKQFNAKTTQSADVLYMNKAAQLCKLSSTKNLYVEAGRGSSKSTDILTERLVDMMFDMPGAPVAWISDTFTNLVQNVIPTVLESLERKGYHEGVHFIIEREPPTFTNAETADLPKWLRPHFWKPKNRIISYKRTIIFYTGFNLTFGSLDRPSTLAGRSFVHLIGDEAKYFKEQKVATMLKGVRGYPEYSYSPFYMGVTFTSDVADPSHIGEYDWMQKYARTIDVDSILLLIRTGNVYNDALQTYIAWKDKWLQTRSDSDSRSCKNALDVANLWYRRWMKLRLLDSNKNFYLRVSSYVNADILSADWFESAISGNVPDLKTAILSQRATLNSGDRFYAALSERHFYDDGKDEDAYEEFTLTDKEDCRVLKYLDRNKPLRLGVDFGNMCSMVIGQEQVNKGRQVLRALKFLYTLAPEYIPELGRKFVEYFAHMKSHVVYLYYDRAGNAYKSVGRSQAADLKRAIEVDGETGRRTGWTVHLMSMGQGTISQAEEYSFMMKILSGDVRGLPDILIDYYACKPLRLSLMNARTRIVKGVTHKDKSSERLPVEELPWRSTNPSDAFKYWLMSRDIIALTKGKTAVAAGNADPLFSKGGPAAGATP